MKLIEKPMTVEGRVEVWKHKDNQPYDQGVLIHESHNTTYDILKRNMLLKQTHIYNYDVDHDGANPQSVLNSGGAIGVITYSDSVGMALEPKAIRKYSMDSDKILRMIATLRANEGNTLAIDEFYLHRQIDRFRVSLDYAGGDITLAGGIEPTQNHVLLAIYDSGGSNYPKILMPSRNYDPAYENDVPETIRDYRIQYDSGAGAYVIMFEAGCSSILNPSKMALYYDDRMGTSDIMAMNTTAAPITKTSSFALTVAWILQFL